MTDKHQPQTGLLNPSQHTQALVPKLHKKMHGHDFEYLGASRKPDPARQPGYSWPSLGPGSWCASSAASPPRRPGRRQTSRSSACALSELQVLGLQRCSTQVFQNYAIKHYICKFRSESQHDLSNDFWKIWANFAGH